MATTARSATAPQTSWQACRALRRHAAQTPHTAAAAAAAGAAAAATGAGAEASKQNERNYELLTERGVQFTPGSAFYRAESAQGRDLAVLAAAVHKQKHGRLRVLDVMSGSGIRGARYMVQADADLVWCNDYDTRNNLALVYNVVNALRQHGSSYEAQGAISGHSSSSSSIVALQAQQWLAAAEAIQYPGIRGDILEWGSGIRGQQQQRLTGIDLQQQQQQQQLEEQQQQQQQRCRVTHVDANRLLCSTYLAEDYYDLVDVDSFGSDTSHLAPALNAVKFGGMLYLTSTDGFCSGGKRPQRSLAAYGSYLRALPHANEQGLRMLIGAAAREGASRGLAVTPLFSLYSYHGPVFRVMLKVERSDGAVALDRQYGFVGHCYVHGENKRVGWRGLSQAWCRCQPAAASTTAAISQAHPMPLSLSGPMWTGPLHDANFVASMTDLAKQWGWVGSAVPDESPYMVRKSKNNRQRSLEVLLALLTEEANPSLPPWYVCIATLAQHLNTTPSRDKLIAALQRQGYAACQCHVENRALRTNATTQQVLQVAVQDCGYQYRTQPGVPQMLLQHQRLVYDQQHQQ